MCATECRRDAAFFSWPTAEGTGLLVDAGGGCGGGMGGTDACGCGGTTGDCAGLVMGGDAAGGGKPEVFFQVSSNKAYVEPSLTP